MAPLVHLSELDRRLWALTVAARQAYIARERRALLQALNDLEAVLRTVREVLEGTPDDLDLWRASAERKDPNHG